MESCQKNFISTAKGLETSLVAQMVKRLPTMQGTWVRSLGQEDPLEKEMAIHSSTIAWKIPWTEEPGRLQSMESQSVGHNWATSLTSLKISVTWKYRIIDFPTIPWEVFWVYEGASLTKEDEAIISRNIRTPSKLSLNCLFWMTGMFKILYHKTII